MSIGSHSAEKVATAIQDQGVHKKGSSDTSLKETPLPLALPTGGNRLGRRFWRWTEEHDLDAVATQPSVFDNPVTLELYRPPQSYENTSKCSLDLSRRAGTLQMVSLFCFPRLTDIFLLQASCAED